MPVYIMASSSWQQLPPPPISQLTPLLAINEHEFITILPTEQNTTTNLLKYNSTTNIWTKINCNLPMDLSSSYSMVHDAKRQSIYIYHNDKLLLLNLNTKALKVFSGYTHGSLGIPQIFYENESLACTRCSFSQI